MDWECKHSTSTRNNSNKLHSVNNNRVNSNNFSGINSKSSNNVKQHGENLIRSALESRKEPQRNRLPSFPKTVLLAKR